MSNAGAALTGLGRAQQLATGFRLALRKRHNSSTTGATSSSCMFHQHHLEMTNSIPFYNARKSHKSA